MRTIRGALVVTNGDGKNHRPVPGVNTSSSRGKETGGEGSAPEEDKKYDRSLLWAMYKTVQRRWWIAVCLKLLGGE
jgi:hypothetical protein